MRNKDKIILSFDLDNTLIDNRKGIINSFNYALKKFNLPEMESKQIDKMIGLPLEEMFKKVSNMDPSILAASFREFYGNEGIYQGHLLKGVKKKLKDLKNHNFVLGVITSKKQEMAEKIVKFLEIDHFFNYVFGETEERKHLGKLDPKLKDILEKKYPDHIIIVIGDHPKDVMLSNNLDCPFIGVLTENHSKEQLKQYKKDKILILDSLKSLTIEKILSLF